MANILERLRDRLKAAGAHRWERIAQEAGVAKTLCRKVYYERNNPGVNTIQPLVDYFDQVERGERQLPSPEPEKVA